MERSLTNTTIHSVDFLSHVVTAVAAYLLGSVPNGFLVGRARGIDIRTVGSGNIGATNAFRFLGRTAGTLVLALDFLKGWLACAVITVLSHRLLGSHPAEPVPESLFLLAGTCAVLGHNYTCWLHFRGGKGIATSAGVLTALVPYALLIILAVWLIVFATTRYVSLASVLAALALPPAVWITGGTLTFILVTSGLTALAVYKHRTNLQRLLAGTEHRFVRSRPSA